MTSRFTRFDKNIAEGTSDRAVRDAVAAGVGRSATFANWYRYVVMDVVFDPHAVTAAKITHWEHDMGVANIEHARQLPRNTIIGTRVIEGTASSAERPMFLFPMLPPSISLPAQPGEHVWVMFENESIKNTDIGYWLCRIVSPGFVEDVNHTHAPRVYDPSFQVGTKGIFDGDTPKYEFRVGAVAVDRGQRRDVVDTATIAGNDPDVYEKVLTQSDAGRVTTLEAVPRFRKRPSDIAIEGTNNTLIALTQNRRGPAAEYVDGSNGPTPALPPADVVGPGTGRIDIVVGRGRTPATLGNTVTNSVGATELAKGEMQLVDGEGDPDLENDGARIMLSQKSLVDAEMGLAGFNVKWSLTDGDGVSNVVVKSDKVRVIGRRDVEIVVGDTAFIVRDDQNIVLRPGDGQVSVENTPGASKWAARDDRVMERLNQLRDDFNKLVDLFNNHVHDHPMGPTVPGVQATWKASETKPIEPVKSDKPRTE